MAQQETNARIHRPFLDMAIPVDATRPTEVRFTVPPEHTFSEDQSGMLVVGMEKPTVDPGIFIVETSVTRPEVPSEGYFLRTWRDTNGEMLDFHLDLYPRLDPTTQQGLKEHFMHIPLEQRDVAVQQIRALLFPDCTIDGQQGLRFISEGIELDFSEENGDVEDTQGKWTGDSMLRYRAQLQHPPYTIETAHTYILPGKNGKNPFEVVQYIRGIALATLDLREIEEYTRLAIDTSNGLDENALREIVNPYVQFVVHDK